MHQRNSVLFRTFPYIFNSFYEPSTFLNSSLHNRRLGASLRHSDVTLAR